MNARTQVPAAGLLSVAGWVLAALAAGGSASTAAPAFETVEIARGIHVHPGRHASIEDVEGRQDIANLGVIIGERCAAVVDTGGSVAIGAAWRARIRELTPLPVCYVINTHVHFDHLLGNLAFREEGVSFVGHAALAEAVEANREFFVEHFGEGLGPDGGPDSIVGPDRTVEDSLELDLGGRVIRLTAHPTAHTSQDLTVFDSSTGTLFLGDLLFMQRVPTLDGSLKGWIRVLQSQHDIVAERVVPGHGPASATWPEALEAQERYLKVMLEEVRAAIAGGVFLEEAVKRVGAAERAQWTLFDEVHPRNVTRAYTELEWE